MPLALVALALAAFGIGTCEFAIFGLLPQMATDFGISVPTAGHLVAAYAIGVVVGAPLLTAITARMTRRTVLIGFMLWFAAGNLLSAVAPTYHLELVARFLTGMPHGAFFGVGSVVAGSLVAPAKRAVATSLMFAGLTIANVVGVPVTTAFGQQLGWRPIYAAVGVIGLLAATAIALAVRHASTEQVSMRRELRAFADLQIWLTLGVATIGVAGFFASFSYITPMLTRVSGFSVSTMPLLLIVFGLGMTTGTLTGGRLAGHGPTRAALVLLVVEIVVSAAFFLLARDRIAAVVLVFVFAASVMSLTMCLQTRIIALAGQAPHLAAAALQSAFNASNALGAWVGGLSIAAGFGYAAPNLVASGLGLVGLVILVVAVGVGRRQRRVAVLREAVLREAERACATRTASADALTS
jgi:DHA1 family inner membrane transport protein